MGRPDDDRIFITVPSSAVGLIIGRGGETVRAMQDQSGARVKIEPANEPNTEERIVNIFGDPQCVAIAKQLVEEKVAEANRGPGGRYDRYNSDRGGYRSRNDYGSNDYSQHGGGEGGYDYNQQYSQYYQQYGYAGNEGNTYSGVVGLCRIVLKLCLCRLSTISWLSIQLPTTRSLTSRRCCSTCILWR